MNTNPQFSCIGHRGAAGLAPENTLLAVQKAIDIGADWIEIDVHTVQNELIVIHDNTLNRTTNGQGSIYAQSIETLRSFDAGQGEKIPFLWEIFEKVGKNTGLHIELKDKKATCLTGNFIHQKIKMGWSAGKIIISSFEHAQLKTIKHHFPHIHVALLFSCPRKGFTQTARELNANAVHLPWQLIRRSHIHEAHESGFRIHAFTVNQKSAIQKMLMMGVDGVFSDFPDRVLEVTKIFNATR
jgi:glycerophosphoryl diester phosphodiesterase